MKIKKIKNMTMLYMYFQYMARIHYCNFLVDHYEILKVGCGLNDRLF